MTFTWICHISLFSILGKLCEWKMLPALLIFSVLFKQLSSLFYLLRPMKYVLADIRHYFLTLTFRMDNQQSKFSCMSDEPVGLSYNIPRNIPNDSDRPVCPVSCAPADRSLCGFLSHDVPMVSVSFHNLERSYLLGEQKWFFANFVTW